MKFLSILLSLCLALALLPSGSWALTVKAPENEPQLSEEETLELMGIASKFTEIVPEFTGDDTLLMAKLVQDLKGDEESMEMLAKIKSGELEFSNADDVKNAEPKEIVMGMISIFDELKAVEVLFQDPNRAVEAVSQEGMLGDDEERLNFYKQNPAQLEADMKGGLHVTFVYLSHVAGFM